MACTSINASAPGSLMLCGEHAVLDDYPALVMAIDKRLYLTLTTRHDRKLTISSDQFSPYQTHLDTLTITKPFDFILAAICLYRQQLTQGMDLSIRSDFAATLGLGSSAAICVATIAALEKLIYNAVDLTTVVKKSRQVIRQVQGLGSGADVSASAYGNIVYYQPQPLAIETLSIDLPLTVIYSGYKTKTRDVIDKVTERFAQQPQKKQTIYQDIAACTQTAYQALLKNQQQQLGMAMNKHQRLQQLLGTSDAFLQKIVTALVANPAIMGAKISGSGLGDCLIGLGKLAQPAINAISQQFPKITPLHLQITTDGVTIDD